MHASTLIGDQYSLSGGEVEWHRPKTGAAMRATITWAECKLIARCRSVGTLPNTVRTLQRRVRRIGERAGYPGISPLTLRHSRAIWLMDGGSTGKPMAVNRVASLMGCSYAVLEKHYAQIEAARLVK